MNISDHQFTLALRSALHYLYEHDKLQRSPLIQVFGLAGRVDASLSLQQILLGAIQALKPADDDSTQSNTWRYYELLYFRYVQGYERLEVANQLGISDRQLVREQKNAIQSLALYLWQAYQLENAPGNILPLEGDSPAGSTPQMQQETWTDRLPDEKPSPAKQVIHLVMDLLRPLIQEHQVIVQYRLCDGLPDLLVPPVTLRHSLLTILGAVIPLAHKGDLILTANRDPSSLAISVDIPEPKGDASALTTAVQAARLLIERAGGALQLVSERHPITIRFTVPALAQILVLVIDDHEDSVLLLQRYVHGTRYSIVGLHDPLEALRVIDQINPPIILIDLMMPGVDGWDLLTQIRMRETQRSSAILICSILPQEQVAVSLGADGFLQKPVLPQDLLKVLDQQVERLSQETKRR